MASPAGPTTFSSRVSASWNPTLDAMIVRSAIFVASYVIVLARPALAADRYQILRTETAFLRRSSSVVLPLPFGFGVGGTSSRCLPNSSACSVR